MRQEPAYTIIQYLGGASKVARILHKCKGAVYRITYPKKRGGSNGLFPATYQIQLLHYARKNNIDLRPDDFFYPERLQALIQESSSPSFSFCDDFSDCRNNNENQQQHSHS
ncbi:hypothetical protein Bcsk_004940 [Bartonella sp. CDC_skunk]|uniref:hypothetical protein n=1 Tax=unclassified Bartonella TaxID=2645622 RepID=UPI000999CCF2|nr:MULTISPECIES: hypothetical protein [unclassified Bartonella]AQX21152.1 hypothetical protein Bcsk_004940 [Bartonella sp. CDC_skunk]AQX26410.1 hypothetical protein Bra60_003900 [Bartonella sp. Raccoon60]